MTEQVNEAEFVRVCQQADSMADAARQLNMHFSTFKRYAKKFNCYVTNQAHKGIKLGPYQNRIPTEDILNGLYPNYRTYKLKIRLIREGYIEDKCQKCGWNERVSGAEFTKSEILVSTSVLV